MRSAKVLSLLLLTTLFWSCKKEGMSPIPEITFIEQSRHVIPDSGKGVTEFIEFLFDFKDGDADVGPIDDPTPWQNIYFVDSRDNVETFYDFPPIPGSVVAPDGITGSFVVRMNPAQLFARTDTNIHKLTDTVHWKVFVRDAADNFSNEVLTDSIVIVK